MGSARVAIRAAALAACTVFVFAVAPARAQTTTIVVNPTPGPAGFAPGGDSAIAAARKRVAAGDLVGAIALMATYVAAHPTESAPARYLADLRYRSGDVAGAERGYLAILALAPNDRETHNRLGGVYAAQDRVADAIAEFQKSLPDFGAYGHLVELHRRLGDLDRFEAEYRRAADDHPLDAGAQYAIGVIYRNERKTGLAIASLERALALQPGACPVFAELGSAYLDANRVDAAVGVLRRCLALEPNNYAALVNLGDAEIAQNDLAKARLHFERANVVRPDGPEALIDLGYIEDSAHDWDGAVAFYLRAIGVDPLARDAYVDLGYDYDQHRLYTLAEAAFLKGLSVSPSDGRLHYLLGVTYADQGKRDLARMEYQRAVASDEPEVARAASRNLSFLQ
jgi:tetratricopeptide (TPR) repeat protein